MMKFKVNIFNLIVTVKSFKKVFRMLFKYNKKFIIINLFITIILGVCPAISIKLMQYLMNYLQNSELKINYMIIIILLYLAIDTISILFGYFNNYYSTIFEINYTGELEKTILSRTKNLSLQQFEDANTYDIIQRAEQGGATQLIGFYQSNIDIIRKIITLISTAVVVIMWRWWMIFLISIIPLFLYLKIVKVNEEQYMIHRERTGKERTIWYLKYLLTKDISFKEIKQNNLNGYFVNKYKDLYKEISKSDFFIINKRFKISIIFAIFDQILIGGIFIFIITETIFKRILLGDTMAYINSICKVKDNIINILTSFANIYKDSLYINQLFEYFNITEVVKSKDKYQIKNIESIKVVNLKYKYKNSNDYALNNISFMINRNETIGIIGKNGSGKTTLIKILSGFYDDYEGEIYVNNINIKMIDQKSLRKLTSVLFQDFNKYELTLKENIILGNLETGNNMDKIKNTLNKYGGLKFEKINLDVQLGNWFANGMQLSGGEWQKLAMGRSFFKSSDFIILDEPTSALDPISRNNFYKNIKVDLNNKIGIIITHKIDEINNFTNNILILDKGIIVGQGNHYDLINNCPIYNEMIENLSDIKIM